MPAWVGVEAAGEIGDAIDEETAALIDGTLTFGVVTDLLEGYSRLSTEWSSLSPADCDATSLGGALPPAAFSRAPGLWSAHAYDAVADSDRRHPIGPHLVGPH